MTHASRIDLYAGIHKALRALMADLVTSLGRMDPDDDADVNATLGRFLDGLALCEKHMRLEDEFLHPAIEARRPGATDGAAREHAGHVHEFEALRRAVASFLEAGAPARRAAAHPLYLHAARWMADNILHMEHEETAHNAALHEAFSDAELLQIHARILASVPPEAMAKYLRWILPATSHGERLAQLQGMRAGAPREAYEGALAIAREKLTPRDWQKLDAALARVPVAA
jgi:hypothetical protein